MTTTQAEHRVAIRVRDAAPDDIEAIVALRLALIREYEGHAVYGQLHPRAKPARLGSAQTRWRPGGYAFFVAEISGAVIGLLRCTESHASPLLLPERFAYLSSAYVIPAWRRHGVLRALLARAERWCAERGLSEVRLHNVPGGAAAAAWAALEFGTVEEVRVRRLAAW